MERRTGGHNSSENQRRKGGKIKRPGIPDLGDRISINMAGISISDLSAKTGISIPYLSRIINNKMTNPTIDVVRRISTGLGITVSELIGETGSSPDTSEVQNALRHLDKSREMIANVLYGLSKQHKL